MKKNVYVVITIIGVIMSLNRVWAEEPVYFPDANLKAAVESALGIINPTPTDMLGLTYLDANSRGIVDITGIGYAVNLTRLDLYYNQLSSLPPEIGNLTNLTYLYLYGNQLISLPAEIGNLTNLTRLSLSSNQLNSLPAEIGNLTNLTVLILGDNQLSSLPPDIWNLTNLTRLGLNNNQLSSLPAEIGNLTSLTRLYLSDNQLSSLPPEIGNLTKLAYLNLWDNPLNTEAYCDIIPLIINNNPNIYIDYDPNPNPFTNDCSTDLPDLTAFSAHWLESDCGIDNNWCGGADLNHINNVDMEDVAIFAKYWLVEIVP